VPGWSIAMHGEGWGGAAKRKRKSFVFSMLTGFGSNWQNTKYSHWSIKTLCGSSRLDELES